LVAKDLPGLAGTRYSYSRTFLSSLNLNSTWRYMTLDPTEPYFLVANLPKLTVLIKSTISAFFQANSITEPSFKSLPYNLPHLI